MSDNKFCSSKIGLISCILLLVTAITGGIWWWHELHVSISTDNAQVTGNIAYIGPKLSGCLTKLYVTVGATVTAGQKLAELDSGALALALQQAEAALELAKANYAKLPYDLRSAQLTVDKSNHELAATAAQKTKDLSILAGAKRDLDRKNTLYRSGVISKAEADEAQSTFDQAQAILDADQRTIQAAQARVAEATTQLKALNNAGFNSYLAQLKQAQTAYASAKLNYEDALINAPISGTVVQIPAVVGENLVANQTILALSNLQTTWVAANIKENLYGRLRLGQQAEVKVDAYPGRIFHGKIVELGKATQSTFALIPTQNDAGNYTKVTQLLPVKIAIDPLRLKREKVQLMPGMSAAVKIHTAE